MNTFVFEKIHKFKSSFSLHFMYYFSYILNSNHRYKEKEGWAPATYLQKAEKVHIEHMARQSGVQIVNRLSDVSNLLKVRTEIMN